MMSSAVPPNETDNEADAAAACRTHASAPTLHVITPNKDRAAEYAKVVRKIYRGVPITAGIREGDIVRMCANRNFYKNGWIGHVQKVTRTSTDRSRAWIRLLYKVEDVSPRAAKASCELGGMRGMLRSDQFKKYLQKQPDTVQNNFRSSDVEGQQLMGFHMLHTNDGEETLVKTFESIVDKDMPTIFLSEPNVISIPLSRNDDPPSDFALSYASTVHAAQGREADYIAFVAPTVRGESRLVNRNLVYTAVSRAKHRLYLIGLARHWNNGMKRAALARRTALQTLLRNQVR